MDIEQDCHGREVVGIDDDGFWWGTENAWHVVGDDDTSGYDPVTGERGWADGPDHPPATPTYFEVSGWLGSDEFNAYVIASSEAKVRQMLSGFGVRDATFLAVPLKTRRKFQPYSTFYVSDEQAAKILGRADF